MSLKIEAVENASTPNGERIRIRASVKMNVKGYAIVDRTFDVVGNVSNEFRHFYALPDVTLEKNQELILFTGKGKNGLTEYDKSEKVFYACYWGSGDCVWNDQGGDTATLIKYDVVDSEPVGALKKK